MPDLPAEIGAPPATGGPGSIKPRERTRPLRGADERGSPNQVVSFLQARTPSSPRHNLPLELTSFIGRERELAEIKKILDGARLLTLTGPGGSGKTRLARRIAEDLAGGFEDGACWVELATLSDLDLVPQRVASVLGVREAPGRSMTEVIAECLGTGEMLLVLDNCEHLVGACAALADTLLRACPNLSILTTSREALCIAGETSWPVPSLSLPAAHHLPPIEELLRYEAVRLFVERTAATLPSFVPTEQNAPAVARVCRELDGIPLAIELAAVRMRALSAEQIAGRLDDRFRLLTGGSRTALPRHQTLWATMEWSHDLLSEREQTLFRRLPVFAGGFTLAAVEDICAGVGVEKDDLLDLLARLVDKSLVSRKERGDEVRYRLLETVRQYGWEKLEESGEETAVRRRHAGFFLGLAEEAEPAMLGPEQAEWLERLEVEHDNLRAALGWLREEGEVEKGLRLGGALWRFWWLQDHFTEGRAQLEALLALPEAPARTAERAKALYVLGLLASRQAAAEDQAEVRAYQRESLDIYRELGDKPRAAAVLRELGRISIELGDWATARPFLDESLRLERDLGNEHGVALTLYSSGWLEHFRGENAVARPFLEESLAIFRKLGDELYIAICWFFLGRIATDEGDYAEARAWLEEIVDDRLPQYPWTVPPLLEAFAGLGAAQGQAVRALRLAGAAAALRESVGVSRAPTWRDDLTRRLKPAWQALGEEEGAAVWAEGRTLTLEEAVGEAMQEPSERLEEARAGPRSSLRIFALGPARVEREGRALTPSDWTYAKSRELLFYLLTHPGRTKEQIGLALWPDASPSQLRSSLHPALHHLRRALGDSNRVVFENGRYAFDRSPGYFFDVEAFESKLEEARRLRTEAPEGAIHHLREAVELYGGDFLEDLADAGWALNRQEELQGRYRQAMLDLGRLLFEEDRYAEAADAYRGIVADDGYFEAAHRELMRCYARLGEHGQALRHYRSLVGLLREELGSSPAPETEALFQRLRRGEEV